MISMASVLAVSVCCPGIANAACPQPFARLLSSLPPEIVLLGGNNILNTPGNRQEAIDAVYDSPPYGYSSCGYVAYVHVPATKQPSDRAAVGWAQSMSGYYYPSSYTPPSYPSGYRFGSDGLMGNEINEELFPAPFHLGLYLHLAINPNSQPSYPQVGYLEYYTYGWGQDIGPCDRTSAATFFATCGPDLNNPAIPQRWAQIPVYLEDVAVIARAATSPLFL